MNPVNKRGAGSRAKHIIIKKYQQKEISMFIKVFDEQGRTWILNLKHIISIFRHPDNDVTINMTGGDHIVCKNAPDALEHKLEHPGCVIGTPASPKET